MFPNARSATLRSCAGRTRTVRAIITRATVDLIPAKQMSRLYNLNYTDNAIFFRDYRTLINRGEIPHVLNLWFPNNTGGWVYQIQAATFYNSNQPPNDDFLLRGLRQPPAVTTKTDSTFLDYMLSVDGLIDFFNANFQWRDLIKPWFDVWLPGSTIEQFVGEVIPTLTPADVAPLGFMSLAALATQSAQLILT